jgi:membrane-bound lytic murein transglycosylase
MMRLQMALVLLFPLLLGATPPAKLTLTDDILPGLKRQLRYERRLNQQLIDDIETAHEIDLSRYHLRKLKGRIRFTQYFTPIIDVQSLQDEALCPAIRLQGSVMARLEDGSLQLVNSRGPQKGLARGASGIELTPMHSVAVDPSVIPFGSVLLARIGNKWHLLLAQDRGSAIKGHHRMDHYLGVGEEAEAKVCRANQFGEAWMMSSKPSPPVGDS